MTQDEIQLISDLYKQGLSARSIKGYVPYTEHTILKYLRKNGIPIRSKAGYRKPFYENYFHDIDTQTKAYLLGYFVADGNVGKRLNSQPVIRMDLKASDRKILELLKNEWDTDIEIKDSHHGCQVLRVHSQKMFDDLAKYGVVPRKTGIEKFPKEFLKDEMIPHFIRGFFDGDGWVTITHHGNRPQTLNLGFCGNQKMLEDIRDYLQEHLGTFHIKVVNRKSYAVLIYGSRKDVMNIYQWMYKNADTYLERKKDKFKQFFQANIERAESHLSV